MDAQSALCIMLWERGIKDYLNHGAVFWYVACQNYIKASLQYWQRRQKIISHWMPIKEHTKQHYIAVTIPKRRAMLDPVLSELPPIKEVTLTALFCKISSRQNTCQIPERKLTATLSNYQLVDIWLPVEWPRQHINAQILQCCIQSTHRSAPIMHRDKIISDFNRKIQCLTPRNLMI